MRSERQALLGRVLGALDTVLHRSPVWRERGIEFLERFPALAAVAQKMVQRQRASQRRDTHIKFDAITLRRTTALSALSRRARARRSSA